VVVKAATESAGNSVRERHRNHLSFTRSPSVTFKGRQLHVGLARVGVEAEHFLDAHILEYEIVAADTAWNSCKPLSL